MLLTPYPPGIPLLIPGRALQPRDRQVPAVRARLQRALSRLRHRHPRARRGGDRRPAPLLRRLRRGREGDFRGAEDEGAGATEGMIGRPKVIPTFGRSFVSRNPCFSCVRRPHDFRRKGPKEYEGIASTSPRFGVFARLRRTGSASGAWRGFLALEPSANRSERLGPSTRTPFAAPIASRTPAALEHLAHLRLQTGKRTAHRPHRACSRATCASSSAPATSMKLTPLADQQHVAHVGPLARARLRARRARARPRRRTASRRCAGCRAAGEGGAAALAGTKRPRRRVRRQPDDARMRRAVEVDEQRRQHADEDRELELQRQRRRRT